MAKQVTATRTKRPSAKAAALDPILEPALPSSTAAQEVVEPKAVTSSPEKNTKKAASHDKKPKSIRDSFTLPKSDYAIFKDLKDRCLASGIEVKKSELLRVALITLAKLDDDQLASAVEVLPRIKTGRPAKK